MPIARNSGSSKSGKLWASVFLVITVLIVGGGLITTFMLQGEAVDHLGCPKEQGPSREVVLLLDVSDRLNQKHREELERITQEMVNPKESARHGKLAVKIGEKVSVYVLQEEGVPNEPVAEICNPGGNPVDRTFVDDLHSGKVISEWRWNQFIAAIESYFPALDTPSRPNSPLLESISIITPRHAQSARSQRQDRNTHLIVVSDLLQHSDAISHYGSYPKAESIPRALRTNLSKVDVTLFRLERLKYEPFQTASHFYWWTDLVEAMGGNVVWQESI